MSVIVENDIVVAEFKDFVEIPKKTMRERFQENIEKQIKERYKTIKFTFDKSIKSVIISGSESDIKSFSNSSLINQYHNFIGTFSPIDIGVKLRIEENTFNNVRSLNEWLKKFPNVKFDLEEWANGNSIIRVKGSASDLQLMASEPELLVEFHESIINAFNTINIEYVAL